MIVKLLNEHYLEFLSLKRGCTGSSESTHVKMSNCWKSHAAAQFELKRAFTISSRYCRAFCRCLTVCIMFLASALVLIALYFLKNSGSLFRTSASLDSGAIMEIV